MIQTISMSEEQEEFAKRVSRLLSADLTADQKSHLLSALIWSGFASLMEALVDKKDIEGLFSLDVLLGGFTYERIQQRKDNES